MELDNNVNCQRLVGALLVGLASLLHCVASVAAPTLPPVGQWLNKAGAAEASVGIDIRPTDGGESLYTRNATRLLNPASVIKLVTVWTALGLLGPDYRWQTRFYTRGSVQESRLQGDLLVLGGGDPKLVIEDLTELIAQMHRAGLRHISGDLILDDSLYAVPAQRAAVFDGQPSEPYNVRPNAAMMNFKATKFTLTPERGRVRIELDPPLARVAIDNQLKLVRGRCRHRASKVKIVEPGTEQQPVLRLQGKYSTGCRSQSAYHAVLNHRQFIAAFFRAAWESAGGTWQGDARFESGVVSSLGANPQPFFIWQSPRTLAQITTDINKFSNNVMTRQLLLHLATVGNNRQATREAGLRTLRTWMTSQHVAMSGWVVENGSGLSRRTRASAAGLAAVLVGAAGSTFGDVIRESLPIIGRDGTMRWRMREEAIAGNGWIKTGSLDGVRSIAGYVRAQSGRDYVVVMLANGSQARKTVGVQDQLLRWLYKHG